MRSASPAFRPDAEDMPARGLAGEAPEADPGGAGPSAGPGRPPRDDEAHRCPPAIPGMGPKTASAPATSIGMSPSPGDGRLAACRGLVPAGHDSGSSVRSQRDARGGNKALKNPLVFSCDPPVGTKRRFGRHCDACVARGMGHNKALKAVARKRLRVIHAVMRDRVPYVEPPADVVGKPPATA
ncbi:transposase [Olsenella sp. Marseille-P4559]|uniref:transposase n=1 Tax=Olsenella sp. Marseille-P4559 TaxID=2364795 RepID=UPI00103111EB|nr:transposase [Olsenella sp. Marseille-P4559]